LIYKVYSFIFIITIHSFIIDINKAYNTDGFDVTGTNVHIHDCYIWNQDDCISVKDDSNNMLFERITCSGMGLVIGSIGSSIVNNITFRDCYLPSTIKGAIYFIYL
jgi:polygalacturonase